jgi:hypothetical protein
MGADRAPHVDMGRYWRVGVGVARKIDMTPPQRASFLVRIPTRRLNPTQAYKTYGRAAPDLRPSRARPPWPTAYRLTLQEWLPS